MPKPLTPEEQARLVLDVYAKHNVQAGNGLMMQNFRAYVESNKVNPTDIDAGITEGLKLGWLAPGKNDFILLTDAGYLERP